MLKEKQRTLAVGGVRRRAPEKAEAKVAAKLWDAKRLGICRGLSGKIRYLTLFPFLSIFFCQTLESSFSAVSAPIFATRYASCRIFTIYKIAHTFAPVENENSSKTSSQISRNF